MATLRWASLAVGLTIFVVAALTGCQAKARPSVAHLPPPTFDGPKIVAPSAAPHVSAPVSTPSGPAGWAVRVPPRAWRWIVIHHSATPSGSMAFFDKEHKAKGWDGVGYHFVIGNGSNTGDGQIEVTPRWSAQKWGAHAKTADNRFNEYGIGICLVGNFDIERPTPAQLKAVTRLVGYLAQTYRISAQNIVGHRDTKPTDCPGRYVSIPTIRQAAAHALGAPDVTAADHRPQLAGGELLTDVSH